MCAVNFPTCALNQRYSLRYQGWREYVEECFSVNYKLMTCIHNLPEKNTEIKPKNIYNTQNNALYSEFYF